MSSQSSRVIRGFFEKIPDTYERINHLLTLGLDIPWRRRAARIAAREGGRRWLDLCTGTGETAAYLRRRAAPGTAVFGLDLTPEMLAIAKRKPEAAGISFVVGDVSALPFEDHSIDLITITFATRNLNQNREVFVRRLAEMRRLLTPGGRLVMLETSQPRAALLRKLRDIYVRLAVAKVGSRLSGARAPYQYLAHSMMRFYSAEELADLFRQAGFEDVRFERWLFGVVALHVAR